MLRRRKQSELSRKIARVQDAHKLFLAGVGKPIHFDLTFMDNEQPVGRVTGAMDELPALVSAHGCFASNHRERFGGQVVKDRYTRNAQGGHMLTGRVSRF